MNLKKRTLSLFLSSALCLSILPTVPMTANAAASDARYIMDAEKLSDDEIAVLFVKGGTSSNGVVTGGTLYYGVYDTVAYAWDEQIVGATAAEASEAALTISNGAPHIAYVNTSGDIAYTYLEDTGWSDVSIITSNDCNELEGILSSPDIEVNSDGVAYVSYMDTQGANDDYYKNADVMLANNSTGNFTNIIVVNGTGWFSSPDGDRQYATLPKLTYFDTSYAVVCNYYQWNKWMGGSDKSYSAYLSSSSGVNKYSENNSNYDIYEVCNDGTDVYALIQNNGYKVVKYTKAETGFSSSAVEGTTTTEIANCAADMTIDNNKLYYAAMSGESLFFYMNGEKESFNASTSINTNHKKASTVVVDDEPYIIYTGSDANNSLVITKYDGTDFDEHIVSAAASDFLTKVADDTTSTIKLTEDITLSTSKRYNDNGGGLFIDKNLTIDLNGYTLDIASADDNKGIYIGDNTQGVTLTLIDSSATGSGVLKGVDDISLDGGGLAIDGGTYYMNMPFGAYEINPRISNGIINIVKVGNDLDNTYLSSYLVTGANAVYDDSATEYHKYTVTGGPKLLSTGKQYKQTAEKDGSYYTRFVFVKQKSEIEGKSKATFTAHYNNADYPFETTKYYTGMTSNGVSYTTDSADSILFVVTIKSSSDISADLTCDLILE